MSDKTYISLRRLSTFHSKFKEWAILTFTSKADMTAHTTDTSNPHSVTASQIGLSAETWIFTLSDGSTVTKNVVVK